MTKAEMARKVQDRGVPGLVLAVMAGRITLRDACWLANCEEEMQLRLLEFPGQMAALVKVIKERQQQIRERREQAVTE